MKKRAFGILLIALIAILVFTFVGCEEPAKTYEVTYSAGEGTGTAPAGASYEAGATVTLPEATGMSKDGYHFKAWSDGTAEYAAGAPYTMPAKAVSFTAIWEIDTYAVEYKAGEGSGSVPASANYAAGATFTLPAATGLTKLGSHFKAWNDGTADYAVGAPYTMPAKAVTFTAQWEANVAYTYPVEYNKGMVGSGEEVKVPEGTAPESGKYAAGATFTLPDGKGLTLEGYRLMGWTDGTYSYELGATFKMPETAVHFTAIWAELHTVTFNPNNSETPETWQEIVPHGSPVARPEEDPTIESGKLFRYWVDEDGEAYSFDAPVEADITLYASFAYKLTFEAGEGEGEVEAIWKAMWPFMGVELPDGTGLTHSEGKIFSGWKAADETIYKAGDLFPASGNQTLTAVWKAPAESVTVSFESNRYGSGDAPASIEGKKPGEEITLPENTFTASVGYEFKGWYVKGQSSSELLQAGDKYTIPADYVEESLVFMAKFDKGDYTITYKAGDHATGDDVVENKKGGNVFLLSEIPFTAEANYLFNGWKLEGGTKEDVYAANAKYTLGANVVFVAQWAHAYVGMDNESSVHIILDFDAQVGAMYDDEGMIYVELTCTLDGTALTVTPTEGEAVNGTFDDSGLNIALAYGGKTYTFGQPPVVTEYTITYKAGEHGTGEDIVATVESSEITLLGLSEVTFAPVGSYIISGWKIEGEADGKTYDLGASCTVSADTVFVAQWERYFANYSKDYTATIMIYLDRNDAILYVEDSTYNMTYTLEGTAISLSIVGGETFNGTFDDNGLSVTITCQGTHIFEAAVVVEPTEPTIVFDAGEGTGDAPTATVTYNSTADMYKVVLPENTFTAPEGKEFKCWSVDGREIAPGKSYMAMSGETVNVTAVWQDAAPVAPAFEGTVFVGNCTTPASGGFLPSGGETFVKLIISTDKTKVQYTLSDGTVKEANLTDESSSANKPDLYGSDASYYSVRMATASYYLVVSADMSKLSMCNNNDELLDGGEFVVE